MRSGLVSIYRLATYASPLRTDASRSPARYHTTSDPPTQYLCLHPLGPFAEFARAHDLRRREQLAHLSQRVWVLRLDVTGLDEIGFDEAARHGLRAADLVADDHSACQRLASRLRARGVHGIVVPSAALPGTRNVVLFGPRVAAPYLAHPISVLDVPASMTAHRGRPPASLLDRVCFTGDRHAWFDAWSAGTPFAFDEPDWALAAGE
jgi:hypothetical protein